MFSRTFKLLALAGSFGLTATPQAGAKPKTPAKKAAPKAPTGVQWQPNYKTAIALGKRTGKPVFVDIYATWCGPCKMLDEFTYSDPRFIKESRNWVMVKVDAEKNRENMALAIRLGVEAYPTMALLSPKGKHITSYSGYWDAPSIVRELKANYKKVKG
jgi:thiol:disulfide interchange protein